MRDRSAFFGSNLVAAALALLATVAWAVTPAVINYQGYLADPSGTPLDTTVNITFRIYNDYWGGTPVWDEIHSTTIVDVYFDVLLGQADPFSSSIFNDETMFLGITVGDDTEMSPLIQFAAVPYSYRVATVDGTAGGMITSEVFIADKANIGAGNTNSGMMAFVAGQENAASGNYSTISGGLNNTAGGSASVVCGGGGNQAFSSFSTIGGGQNNIASEIRATVGGGLTNTASGDASTVSGGSSNTASAWNATVGGGGGNAATNTAATVGGGYLNYARGEHSVVAGGGGAFYADSNSASGNQSVIGGGHANIASGNSAVVAGGLGNRSNGYASVVSGGNNNQVLASLSTIGGGQNNIASQIRATVGGGLTNTASGDESTVSGGSNNTASAWNATVGGGGGNAATNTGATVGGGYLNYARGEYAVVAGGGGGASYADSNSATGNQSAIGGGRANVASGYYAVVAGGSGNRASGFYSSTVSGGASNTASGQDATVCGGYNNTASGDLSTTCGGTLNAAAGAFSFAAGRQARALEEGSFVWADGNSSDRNSMGSNTFTARATGGFYLYSSLANGAWLPANQTAWVAICDSTKKHRYGLVNTQEVLDKVARLPIETWSYKWDPNDIRHVGPMAQDFWSAFHLGEDSLGISTIDPDGIALAAIQELTKRNEKLEEEMAVLRAQVQTLLAGENNTFNKGK